MAKSSWVSAVPRVEKPWGHEEHFALVEGRYCGKVLCINEGHALSLQYHERKEETIAVQSGRLLFEVGDPVARWSRSNCSPERQFTFVPVHGTV